MAGPDETTAKPAEKIADKILARARDERRRFRRVPLSLTGRLYIPATQEEVICTVDNISPGDAMICCNLKQEPQGNAVVYLDGFGRIEGGIVRHSETRFAMDFICSPQKRERMADQLTLMLNRDLLSESDLRRYDRAPATVGSNTQFTRAGGELVRCEVIDLSLTGISVRTDTRPPVGEHILIGQRAGRVARHHVDGIGIEFLGVSPASLALFERGTALGAGAKPTAPNDSYTPGAALSAAGGRR